MIKIVNIGVGFNVIHDDTAFCVERYGIPDYLFLLFRSKVEIFIEKESFIVDSSAIIIYPEYIKYKYGYAGEPLVHDWFHFHSDFTDNKNETSELFKTLNIPMNTIIYIDEFQTISNSIRDLEYEYRQPGIFQNQLLDAKIRALFYKIACICHQEKNIPTSMNKYRKEFINIRNQIYRLHGIDISVSYFAEQVDMSESYFRHVYKILFNVAPGHDIIQSRLQYACNLLKYEKFSVASIAEKCKYSNTEHFSRQFKQYMKCSPCQYRNREFM